MKFRVLAAALVILGNPIAASACTKLQPIDRAQVTELMNTVSAADANPLDQIFAFDTLMCAEQSAVRDFTLRLGAKSSNPTIASQVVLRAIFEKENLQVRLLDVEGLSDAHYERIKTRPIESFALRYKDLSAGCASFIRDNQCEDSNLISISGNKLAIRARWNRYDVDGAFVHMGDVLSGSITFIQDQMTFPAEIDLF